MKENFKVGDHVVFMHNGKLRYLRISKIAMTADGMMAIFGPGCGCSAIKKPLTELYYTKEELRKELANNEN